MTAGANTFSVTLTGADAAAAADALEYLASVDDGEYTDGDRLIAIAIAQVIRAQFPDGSLASHGKGVLRDVDYPTGDEWMMDAREHARRASELLQGIDALEDRLDSLTEDERLQRVAMGATRVTNQAKAWTRELAQAHALTALALDVTDAR